MLSDYSSQVPLPTDNTIQSSQLNSTQDENQQQRRRPNQISMNLLNDNVQKVVDTTAVEVRVAFENFLEE